MIRFKKIVALPVVIAAAGLFCSITMVENAKQLTNESSEIWSTREVSFQSVGNESEGILSMQGTELDSEVDYDRVIPISSGVADVYSNIESNMGRLDSAMQESAEIMRSLNTQSSGYIDGGQILIPSDAELSIDEFEMQKIEPENKSISASFNNKVIAAVDISMPKYRTSGKKIAVRRANESNGVISSATMKVVNVLLDHGEDARALSMIESELFGVELN